MASLAARIIKSREFTFETGGFKFTLTRPTECQWIDEIAGEGSTARFLPYIIGWEGVNESDVIASGDPLPLKFDAEVCKEWMADRSDLYGPIIGAINKEFNAHVVKRGDTAKN